MSRSDFLREVLARATHEGAFGNVEFVSLVDDDGADKAPQFMSTVMFTTIRLRDGTHGGIDKDVPLVVKLQQEIGEVRAALNSDVMFANEVCMYQKILPALGLGACQVFPKCYYGRAEGGDNFNNDVVVLEDLREEGFQVAKHKLFLDLPHLTLAMRKIGEFHGLSFKFKQDHKNSDTLENKLRITKFSKAWWEVIIPFLTHATKKHGNALVEQGYDKTQFDSLLDKYDNAEEFFKFITQPEEPFAVICHGDVNRNNFLYKYNSNGQQPVDIKFFDLQNSVYSDPSIDLFFFLYMNTNRMTRKNHWDELFNVYWDGLMTSAPQPGFTRSEFFANLHRKAFIGFVEPSFFIPCMFNEKAEKDFETRISLTLEEQLAIFDKEGGKPAYEAVNDVLIHLVDSKALQNALEHCTN